MKLRKNCLSLTSIGTMVIFVFLSIQLTSTPVHAAFPGVNGKIAFTTTRNGNAEIFTMNPDGTNQTNLTNSPVSGDSNPQWSPDATKIVFDSSRTGSPQIFVMNADGSEVTQLSDNTADEFLPDWSPDGTKIAFVSNRDQRGDCNYVGNCEIYVMNADGSNLTRLTSTPNLVLDFNPKWSPDGSKITFFRGTAFSPHDIWVMDADGSNQTQLTNFGSSFNGLVTGLDWSPDGTKIVYARTGGGALSDIWVMSADGSNQVNLTNTPGFDDSSPAWSPDGSLIVFQSTRDVAAGQLYTMNPDGSNVTRLTFSSGPDYGPDWAGATVNQLTSLSPAKIWVGLKNSDDVGVKFDLKAEAYVSGVLVTSGQLNGVTGGSSGFNNAHLQTIAFAAFAPVKFPAGSTLSIKLYVRNTCSGSTHNAGTARLWYNDSTANSQFGATIGENGRTYYLLSGFTLGTNAGAGPKAIIDVAAGAPCSDFKPFGMWTITP